MANDSKWRAWFSCAFLVLGAGCGDDSSPATPPAANPPSKETCDNKLDDDGDGKADCDDPDCAGEPLCAAPTAEVCDNKLDDDGDGKADCDDPECASKPLCAPPAELCDNKLDDDGDSKTDCDDTDCAGEPHCAPTAELCDNKLDDDGDSKTDCDDADCAAEPVCAPPPVELCNNNLDDDGDGKIDCQDGDCAGVDPCIQEASPGDIVVAEIMVDPASVADEAGEWIELRNTTGGEIDIAGWVLHDIDQNAPQWHVIGGKGPVVIAAGGTLVLGALADPALNGGVTVDYAWATFGLPNDTGEIVLEVKGEQIDVVKYATPAWPFSQGHSLSLDPAHLTSSENDDPLAWCAGASAYNSLDYGTPGKANPACP
jgi:hypothetical protein